MKKRKIFIGLAMIASTLFTLSSCGSVEENTDNSTITGSSQSNIAQSSSAPQSSANKKDRGSIDLNPESITLPEELIASSGTGESGSQSEIIEEPEIPDNAVDEQIVDEYKLLSAKKGIGYKFLGWYIDDKLFSKNENIKILLSEADNVYPKFEIDEAFKYFEFQSTEDECIITGLKEGYPYDLIVPEGVTEIAKNAFSDTNVCFITFPSTLNKLDGASLAGNYIVRYTFNSIPEILGNVFYTPIATSSPYLIPVSVVDYFPEIIIDSSLNTTVDFDNEFEFCKYIDSIDDSAYFLVEDYLFELNQGELRLDKYLGNEKEITLPDLDEDLCNKYNISNYYINENAFINNINLESITLSNQTEYIDDYAFSNCTNLKTITLNEGLLSIGDEAFKNCYSIGEITIPSTIAYIGDDAFENCSQLYTIYLLTNSDEIYYSSSYFYGAYNIKEIITNKDEEGNVKTVGDFKFFINTEENYAELIAYLGNDKEITIPKIADYPIVIGSYIFKGNNLLEKVTFNENIIKICTGAFDGCNSLKEINTLNVTEIESEAFEYCYALTKVTMPKVEEIGSYAFYICKSLNNISFPKIESISYGVFYNCYSLYQIELPETLTSIDYNAFGSCTSLFEIINKSNLTITKGSSDNGYVANYAKNVIEDIKDSIIYEDKDKNFLLCNVDDDVILLSVLDKSITKLTIPSNITLIAKNAFNGLSVEELDTNVFDESMEYYASDGMIQKTLTKVTLGKDITYLQENAFKDCYNLNTINLDNITVIDNYALSNTSIEKLDLTKVTTIGYNAFENCKKLISVSLPKTLSSVPDECFSGCTLLQAVTLNEGITDLGYQAFNNCKSLHTVNIPSTLNSLETSVFYNCENLESISFKNTTITSLTYELFGNCINLVNIELPDTLTTIDTYTFDGCDKLEGNVYRNGCYLGTTENKFRWLVKARNKNITECIVNEKCEKIYSNAFSNCYKLKKIVVPASCNDFEGFLNGVTSLQYLEMPYYDSSLVFSKLTGLNNVSILNLSELVINGGTRIPEKAFQNFTNLKSITINEGLTTISNYAFDNTGLTNIILPSSITGLGQYAFSNCNNLESADLSQIKLSGSLATGLFKNCYSLNNVQLSNDSFYVTNGIGSYAFQNCTSLESISLTKYVKTIGTYAFQNSGLKSINLSYVKTINDHAFSGSDLETLDVPYYNSTGSEILTIYNYAFANCKSLKTLTYHHATSTTYDNTYYSYLFSGCTNLTNVTLDSSVGTLGKYMFENCTSLKTINISKVLTIKDGAFKGSGLESIDIPSGITINNNVFEKCEKLTEVTFHNGFDSFGTGVFMDCISLNTITMPTVNKWKTINSNTFKGCKSLSSFDFTDVTTIGESAFENTGFTSLEIPSGITLYTKAFANCSKLLSVNLNTNLSTYCFSGCTSLEEVSLADSIITISEGAFSDCIGLNEFIIPETITSIGAYAFETSGLTEIVIPNTVTSIGNYAFAYCDSLLKATINGKCTGTSIFQRCLSLSEVIIGEGVDSLTLDMFAGDRLLSKVTLPSTLTSIGQRTFNNCKSLTSIIIPEGVLDINSYAFGYCYNLVEVYNLSNATFPTYSSENDAAPNVWAMHTSLLEESILVIDNDYVFAVIDDKAYLVTCIDDADQLTLPGSFSYKGNVINEYEIKERAFDKTIGIINADTLYKTIFIPNGVTKIGAYAFYASNSLTDVFLPDSLKEIGEYAFNSCVSLMSITIPEGVTNIANNAFDNCDKLVEAYNLSNATFPTYSSSNVYAPKLFAMHTSQDEESIIKTYNNFIYTISNNKAYLLGYNGVDSELVLPSKIIDNDTEYSNYEIYKYAFSYCEFDSVLIPSEVTKINEYAFYYVKMNNIYISSSIKESQVTAYSFLGVSNVKYAEAPSFVVTQFNSEDLLGVYINSGSTIKGYTFSKSPNMKYAIIANTVKTIEKYSFYGSGLEKIYYYGTYEEYAKVDVTVEGYDAPHWTATRYYYSDKEPTGVSNYWHFVDGIPTSWK